MTMTHVSSPANPTTNGARRRRAARWCGAAATAGALALSASPAAAADAPPVLWGEPVVQSAESLPFIARSSSGEVWFGLKGSQEAPTHVHKLVMRVYTPEHTRLVENSLTPVGDAPGGWSCTGALGSVPMESGGDRMECTTDYHGALPATGQEWGWKIKVAVPEGWPMPPEWEQSTNGWAAIQAHGADGAAWSKSISMGLRTTKGPDTPDPRPAAVWQPKPAPAAQPDAKPAEQPAVQPAAQPAEQPAAQPDAKPAEQPAAQPAQQPAANPAAGLGDLGGLLAPLLGLLGGGGGSLLG
ncbi:hypothetical protein ACFQLX_22820 [Streptomyces polyrhachis]|uniref:Uncharacterized protein n=1 Tax=Streptomyces polyrhachis TaxID=1282885 RepID=A0ABW2GNC6_9ACTN